MDATNPSADTSRTGTKDGTSAADHDEPYAFGRRPSARAPYPFNERQYARLLILRSRLDTAVPTQDRAA